MKIYSLKRPEGKYFLKRKGLFLNENDLQYTESGNDITITLYQGSDTDIKVVDKIDDIYILALPS